ncbi:MAG: proteasome subunit alpha [Frankiales bacterium]|nr:proteasome subunit alpha [Frankiales bacterium]
MSIPFYVSPEQVIRDKADYARKGISRGRSVIVLQYAGGLLFVAENRSRALHKISEIYDRIAFAAVGKYNEFENLRVAGVRLADLRGYSYDRRDVTGRSLANAYAQTLGTIFTETQKPYEVEIVVAEVGDTPHDDQLYRLTFDGSVGDEHGFVAMGGSADTITAALRERWSEGMAFEDALRLAVELLGVADPAAAPNGGGPGTDAGPRVLTPGQLEVAVLDRDRPRRKFRRIPGQALAEILQVDDDSDDGGGDLA